MWFRRKKIEQRVSRVQARVARLATNDLPMWADQTINDTGRSLTAWRRRGEMSDLDEALLGAEALAAVLREIRARTTTAG